MKLMISSVALPVSRALKFGVLGHTEIQMPAAVVLKVVALEVHMLSYG
jgi:hypothetical protein